MLPVGTVLSGRYRIDRYLSSGGFGNTYVATNIKFGNVVAVKEFFINKVSQRGRDRITVSVSNPGNSPLFESQLEKFNKEAQRIYNLKNPNIIAVHDLFDENGTAYYIMDYIDGESLSERLKRTGRPLPESEVRRYLPQILDALNTVHSKGFFHLDLKPGNIMVDKKGNTRLIDFGASKQEDSKGGGAKTSSLVCFTEGYAPIEQSDQNMKQFGPWTDIYALGATLYALLTNTHPPKPTDIDDDRTADKSETLPFPSGVGKEMREMVLWMMSFRRFDRPQNVQEIQDRYLKQKETPKPTKVVEKETEPLEAKEIDVTIVQRLEKSKEKPTEKIKEKPKEQPKPKEEPRKAEEYKPDFVIVSDEDSETSNNRKKILISFLIAVGLIIGGYYLLRGNMSAPTVDAEELAAEEPILEEAEIPYIYPTTKGTAKEITGKYIGTVNTVGEPHGVGKAVFDNGMVYEGEFVNGTMEGKAVFVNAVNSFEGTFKNNEYQDGKLTDNKTGQYFVGSYLKGQPYNGTWYTKEGKENGKLVDGKEQK